MTRMLREKKITRNPSLIKETIGIGTSREELLYPPSFTPRHAQALPKVGQQSGFDPPPIHGPHEIGPPPAPLVKTYTYPSMPPPIGQT